MTSYLFNFLQAARKVRDFLVVSGPISLRTGADAIHEFEEAMRRAAEYIEQLGPSVQFMRGLGADQQGGVDSAEAQSYLNELQEMHALAEKHVLEQDEASVKHKETIQRQMQAGVNAGLLDWIGKIDPETKKLIWNMLLGLITKVLVKSGIEPGAAPRAKSAKKADK